MGKCRHCLFVLIVLGIVGTSPGIMPNSGYLNSVRSDSKEVGNYRRFCRVGNIGQGLPTFSNPAAMGKCRRL